MLTYATHRLNSNSDGKESHLGNEEPTNACVEHIVQYVVVTWFDY